MTTTLCLLGPPGAGKSALLACLSDACRRGAHGWPDGVSFRVRSRGPASPGAPTIDDLTDEREGGRLRRHSLAGPGVLAPYRLTVDRSGGGLPSDSVDADVYDLPGDLLEPDLPTSGDAADETAHPHAAALAVLSAADAIVVVLPMEDSRYDDRRFARGLLRVVDRIAGRGGFRCRRLVLAWTFYDALLASHGGEAFDAALDREAALHRLADLAARRREGMDAIERLEDQMDGAGGDRDEIRVVHFAVSATGFDAESGAVATGADGVPFLAADPLLAVLFGLTGSLHHLCHRPPDRARDASAERMPPPSRWRALFRRLARPARR